MLSQLIEGSSPVVVAHRGFTLHHPENTLPAFHAALDAGADMLETDVHASSDGQAMLSHDPGLQRVAGHGGLVDRYTADQLRSVDLGGGATMPTLLDALREFPHVPFSVDVKHPRAIRPTIDAILAADAVDRVVIGSFSHRRRKQTARGLAGVHTLASPSQTLGAYLASRTGLDALGSRALSGVHALFLPTRAYGVEVFHPRFVEQATRLGLMLGAWTINDPDEMVQLWRRGVRAVITDRIDLAVEARQAVS